MTHCYPFAEDTSVAFCGLREPILPSEQQLVAQWLQFLPGTLLYDTQGNPVLILDPGQRNHHAGPDILGAKFYYDRTFVTGAVECHLKETSWWSHGHHQDPRYTAVVLHVVRRLARRQPAPCHTIVLPQPSQVHISCNLISRDLVSYPERPLWQGSIHRWFKKVQAFMVPSGTKGKEVLLKACFRVLGAVGNEAGFERLSAPVSALASKECTLPYLEQLLTTAYYQQIQSWKRRGVRPHHHPRRRLEIAAALGYFIAHWREDYYTWPTVFHQAFRACLDKRGGAGILTELLGNAFYPYLAGKSLQDHDFRGYHYWCRCWYRLNLPGGYGKYRRRFQPLLGRALLRTFWSWQGLLYLDRTYCRHRHCRICPLRKDHGRLD